MSVKSAEQFPVHAVSTATRPYLSVGTDLNAWGSPRT